MEGDEDMSDNMDINTIRAEIKRIEDIPEKSRGPKIERALEEKRAKLRSLLERLANAGNEWFFAPLAGESTSYSSAKCDKDVRDFVFDNTVLKTKKSECLSISDAMNSEDIDPSSYIKSVNILEDVLQRIKERDPNSFEALRRLEPEIRLYSKDAWLDKWGGGAFAPLSDIVHLQAWEPEADVFYHELIHASDDGKELKGIIDFASKSSNLSEKIENYRKNLLEEWKQNYSMAKQHFDGIFEETDMEDKLKSTADPEEKKKLLKELRNFSCQQRVLEKFFLDNYWFVGKTDGRVFIYSSKTTKDVLGHENNMPHCLENNMELIACAFETLEYGTATQRDAIKNDKELMEILQQWKDIKSH